MTMKRLIQIQRRYYRILFFGGDEFSVHSLKHLVKEHTNGSKAVTSLEIVTNPERALAKTPNPVLSYLRKSSLPYPVHTPTSLAEFTPTGFDIAAVVSYGHFLPSRLLSLFPKGGLNVHPSLLPKYRGASPLQYTILNQDVETGVSIIDLSPKKFDIGRIYAQEHHVITNRPWFEDLRDELGEKGGRLLVKVLSDYDTYSKNAREQVGEATLARKLTRQDCYLRLTDSVAQIEARRHAIGRKASLLASFRGKRLLIRDVIQTSLKDEAPLGTLRWGYDRTSENIQMRVGDGWLGIVSLQVANRREVTAKEFANGYGLTKNECITELVEG